MRKGEEFKTPRHASAAATRDYTWYIPDRLIILIIATLKYIVSGLLAYLKTPLY
jgi:hypothetical protein